MKIERLVEATAVQDKIKKLKKHIEDVKRKYDGNATFSLDVDEDEGVELCDKELGLHHLTQQMLEWYLLKVDAEIDKLELYFEKL